jgi:hypothetical protein
MKKKNLVIVPFGNNSIESSWVFDDTHRNFDVVVLFYHPQIKNPRLLSANPSFSLFHLADFKWIMIRQFFERNVSYLDTYDYFFFPDDDIEMDKGKIELLFQMMRHYSLHMTQPVLSKGSFKSWKILKQKWFSGMRYLSTVELMCPALSREAVKDLLPTFSLNKSGWGIDILWGELVRRKFGDKSIAVFDPIAAKHTKPVGKGELYTKLGKSAFEERDEIFKNYSITKTKIYHLPIVENNWINRVSSYFSLKKSLANLNNHYERIIEH